MHTVRRNLYFVMDKEEEHFVEGTHKGKRNFSFTSDIDYAFNTYNKERAFEVCHECNNNGMDVKVVIISAEYTMWTNIVTE